MRDVSRNGSERLGVGYLRVSTEDQHLGPDAQRAAIERWAAANKVTIVAWHVDQGISGAAELSDRPALQAAIDSLKQHSAGVLLVAKRDRLARDVVLAALIERLARNQGARVVSAAGEGGDDPNDPSGMLMRRIVDAFAEYERALIRSRTKAALRVKRNRGERAGNVPYGYRLAEDAKTLTANDDERAVIARVHTLRSSGLGVRRIVAVLEQEGVTGRSGKPLCKSAVENMVRARHEETQA